MTSPLRQLPLVRAKLMNYSTTQSSFRTASIGSHYESRSLSPDNSQTSRLPGLFEFPEPRVLEDTRKLALCTDRVKQHAITRDVSYRHDIPAVKSPPDDQRELAEALGLEASPLVPYPLPTDLKRLEEMVLQGEGADGLRAIFGPAVDAAGPQTDQAMEEYEHRRFLEEVDKARFRATQTLTQHCDIPGSRSHRSLSKPKPVPPLLDLPKPIHLHNGKPSGKREIQLLGAWLDYMIQKYLESGAIKSTRERTRIAQIIYTAAYREIARQVSVHCSARGLLMDRIWNRAVDIFAQSEVAFVKKLEELKANFKEIVAKGNKSYEEKLKIVTKKYADLNADLRREAKRAEDKESENEELKGALSRERKRIRDLQESVKSLANTSVNAKIEEEKKRLSEEFNKMRFKAPIPKRSIATSTTEDQDWLESLETHSIPGFTFNRSLQKTVLLQGYYDDKTRFHRLREIVTDERGHVEVKEFAGQLVEEVPAYHKETNTEDDLGWMFLTKEQLDSIGRRMVNIPEAEIAQGMWVEDYAEFAAEQRRHDFGLITVLKTLWNIKHPILTGVVSRGIQLFGHEILAEIDSEQGSESSRSSLSPKDALELQQTLGPMHESVEVMRQLQVLKDCLREAGKAGGVGRLGLELVRTARVAENSEIIQFPPALIGALGKALIASTFGAGKGAISEGKTQEIEFEQRDTVRNPLFLSEFATAEVQTEVLEGCIDCSVQTDPIGDTSPLSYRFPPPNEETKLQPQAKIAIKRSHPAGKVLSDLLQAVGNFHSETHTELRPAMHIKSLLKTINSFYSDRIATLKETPTAKRASLVESLYEQMLTKYGLRNVAEKKLREVLTTAIVSSEKSQRVSLFLDFAGGREKYSTEDWNCYVMLSDTLQRTQVGVAMPYDESALENFVSLERAEHVTKTFLEGKIASNRLEEVLKSLSRLAIRSEAISLRAQIDKVGLDSLLTLLLDQYQAAKRQIHSTMQWPNTDLLPWKEAEDLVSRCFRWRELWPLVQKELSLYVDPAEGEKTVRMDTLLSALLDLGVYREGDAV